MVKSSTDTIFSFCNCQKNSESSKFVRIHLEAFEERVISAGTQNIFRIRLVRCAKLLHIAMRTCGMALLVLRQLKPRKGTILMSTEQVIIVNSATIGLESDCSVKLMEEEVRLLNYRWLHCGSTVVVRFQIVQKAHTNSNLCRKMKNRR